MKQSIPYLIAGKGKLASHFKYYLQLLDIPVLQWHRNSEVSFTELAIQSEKILVLISDGQIEKFIIDNSHIKNKIWIHCSGSLNTDLAFSAHPLMTFSDQLYDLDTYKKIPFILSNKHPDFSGLFPELPNPAYVIRAEQKAYYHAWCSIAGNFTSILWSKFFNRLESKFNIPVQAAHPYLKAITDNLINIDNPLTGPLARDDQETIDKHMNALKDDNIKLVYEAFTDFYYQEKKS